jgi:hypothetical protein
MKFSIVLIFALYISFFFAKSKRASGKFLYYLLSLLVGAIAFIEKGITKFFGAFRNIKVKKVAQIRQSKDEELFDDPFFEVDNGMQELTIPKLGIRETRTNELLEANPTLHDRVYHKSEVEGDVEVTADTVEEDTVETSRPAPKKRIIDFTYGTSSSSLRASTEQNTVTYIP